MKNYKDSVAMQLLNILLEWLLIVAAYFVSAAIRRLTPLMFARFFAFRDALSFSVIAYLTALFSVFVYFILGDYKTIHYRRVSAEAGRVLIVQMISGYFISALLYWIRGGQFSRMWMIQYMFVSFVFLIVKRIAFHTLSDRLFGRYLKQTRVLLLGGGAFAKRYTEALKSLSGNRMVLAGYLAEEENPDLEHYLGAPSMLEAVVENGEISELVITDSQVSGEVFRHVLEICHAYGVRAYIIPVYNDYLMNDIRISYREDIPGLCLIPVDVMRSSDVLGVNVAITNMDQTVETITKNLESWRGEYICVSNVHTTVMAYEDETYRKVQNDAVMRLPDGGPLSTYSRREGNHTAMRVTGPDLMREMLKRSKEEGWRHFFYGSTEQTLSLLRKQIEENYPGAVIAGMIAPPFGELTAEEDEAYVKRINGAKPDFLWVGLGAPKQERWMAAHKGSINALMIGVGAAFDYESGNIRRAPEWMQKANLEWLYRMMQDPGRLFGRYVRTNAKYLWLTRK